jgi:hypothetical protein
VTILGRGDLSPARRPHRRGPVLVTVVAAGVVAAAGWLAWHALRGHDNAGARVAVRTCVTPTPAPTPAQPGQVTVRVLNATDKVGLAHQVAAALRTHGFRIGKVGNTKASVTGVASISFGPTDRAAAIAVSEHVPGAVLAPASTGGVTLSIGPAFTGLATPSDASAAHTRDLASASPRPTVCTTP